MQIFAGPGGRAVKGVGLHSLVCWDHGFESHRGHGRLSVVCVVCCQVEVSATGWSLVQRSLTDCVVSVVCDQENLVNVEATGGVAWQRQQKKKIQKFIMKTTCLVVMTVKFRLGNI